MTEPRAAQRDGARFFVGASWLGAAAASVCFCVNLLFIEDRAALWTKNELEPAQRRLFVVVMIVAAALPGILSAIRIRGRSLHQVANEVWLWGHRVSPLVLLAPIAPLIDRESFMGRPITSLSYMLVIGLCAAAIGTRCLDEGYSRNTVLATERSRALVPAALTGAVCLSLFAHFAFYAVMRHHQMRSDAYDLAIFDNMMWHLTHGEGFTSTPAFGPGGNHLHRHTTFGAPLFIPFYAIWPRSETLIMLQAAFAASTTVPIFLLGRRLLQSDWIGFVFALCYALYAPNHGPVFYDFHFLTMAAPLFVWVFYLSFTEHTRALVVMTILTLAWREDTGAVLAFAGMVLWLFGVHRRRTLFLLLASAVYFTLVKFVFMPLGGSHASYAFYYSRLQAAGAPGFWAVIETSLTNPYFVFDEVFGRKRLLYILHLFVPLLFFPLRDRRTWIALIPGAIFTLLASRDPLFQIYFQYTVYWAPSIFLCTLLVLRHRFVDTGRRSGLHANTAAILLTTLLTSYFYGSVFHSPTMKGGFTKISYEWTEEDAERLETFRELVATVPADASIALTSREVPHVSNRRNAYSLEGSYFNADYLLVRRQFVRKGKPSRRAYLEALDTGLYQELARKGDFILWKRTGKLERAGQP